MFVSAACVGTIVFVPLDGYIYMIPPREQIDRMIRSYSEMVITEDSDSSVRSSILRSSSTFFVFFFFVCLVGVHDSVCLLGCFLLQLHFLFPVDTIRHLLLL